MNLTLTTWNVKQNGLRWYPGPPTDDGTVNPAAQLAFARLGADYFRRRWRWVNGRVVRERSGPYDLFDFTASTAKYGWGKWSATWLKHRPWGITCLQEPGDAEWVQRYCKRWGQSVVTWPGYKGPSSGPRPGGSDGWRYSYDPVILSSMSLANPRRLRGDYPGHDGRGLLVGDLEVWGYKRRACVCNFHTNVGRAAATIASYGPIWESLAGEYDVVLICGDFNVSPSTPIPGTGSPPLALRVFMAKLGYVRAIHHGRDGVWVSGARVLDARTEDETVGKSDHAALSCELEV